MNDKQSGEQSNGSGNGNGSSGQTAGPVFLLQQLYIKDLSFESPNTPLIFQESGVEPETELNLRNSHKAVGDSLYEVILHISVHAKRADKTIFLAELDQAGLFLIKGYTPEQSNRLLGTQCPTTLFPYAREALASLVGKGGFPPLILQPINFEALYAQALEKQGRQN